MTIVDLAWQTASSSAIALTPWAAMVTVGFVLGVGVGLGIGIAALIWGRG